MKPSFEPRLWMFIYGIKVKLTTESNTRTTVMILNLENDFFLEFLEYKDKLKIRKSIFLPYIRNVRAKPESHKLKIRMRNEEENIYLTCDNERKLVMLEHKFTELIEQVRSFPYAVYKPNNLLYYALYELKIFRNKEKIFTERDVQFLIDTIKIRKKKYKINFQVNSTATNNNGNLLVSRTNSHRNDIESNLEYCRRIQKKLGQLLEKGKKLDMKVILDIFVILSEKEELFSVFEMYFMNKEERSGCFNANNRSYSLRDINPNSVAPDVNMRMPFENLMAFIQEVQQEKIDGELIETLNSFFQSIRVESVFDTPKDHEIKSISFTEFCCYVFSELNSAFDPDKSRLHHDLEHPLAHYAINSSHNTYLVGHQLYGKATVEGIERAIEQGCRCIELDCWDGKNGEPIVTHGHTLTSDYPFSKMVEKLSKIAFRNNKFPLVISLETHCCLEQREKIALILQKHFGKRLLILNNETVKKKYKLSQLMKTVLIKTCSNYPDDFKVFQPSGKDPKDYDNDTLSRLTSLFKEKMNGFQAASPFGMISCKESKFFDCIGNNEIHQRIRNWNQTNLFRIYPDGKRVASSNFNPIECWMSGVQLVALNVQTKDEFSLINKTKFMENGGHKGGFLLKPEYMRLSKTLQISTFHIEVISGQIICDRLLDEHDFLEIFVVSPDKEHKNQKFTLSFSSNFIHPVVLQNYSYPMEFVIIYPEMSFLVFKIRSNSQSVKLIGCLPFSCIRTGLRVIELSDKSLFYNGFSYLLIQVIKK